MTFYKIRNINNRKFYSKNELGNYLPKINKYACELIWERNGKTYRSPKTLCRALETLRDNYEDHFTFRDMEIVQYNENDVKILNLEFEYKKFKIDKLKKVYTFLSKYEVT